MSFDIFYPIQVFANWITYSVIGLTQETHLADAVNFIFYDTIKIFLLLIVMIYIVSYIRTYVNAQTTKDKLGGKKGIFYHIIASLIGVISPFCSCSSIPLFIGFIEAGVPLGITFSFLVTSPLVNEAAIAVLWATFGFKVMLIYLISGITIGVLSGMIIGWLKLEKLVEEYVYKIHVEHKLKQIKQTQKQRNEFAYFEVKSIIKKVWLYIIIGVSLGGFFHGFLPKELISNYLGKGNLFAVPLAVILGVPLYANVLGTIPIAESLISKGLPIGTALAFLMAVTALSLPEMIILKKVMKTKLIVIFVSIVTVAIIFTGYLFNIMI